MKSLVKRTYRYKNPSMTFYCPLCATERSFTGQPRLIVSNFIQIAIITSVMTMITMSFMGPMVFIWFFITWGLFELGVRMSFKKEIPCPHCGFDAAWYKKDVRVAKRKVEEFWERKNVPSEVVEGLVEGMDVPLPNPYSDDYSEQEISPY